MMRGDSVMRLASAGVVGFAVLFAGCAVDANRPKVAPVSGKVSQKGKPLTAGDIVFIPAGGTNGSGGHIATGQIGPDGTYRLTTFNTGDGAVLGTHKVTVVVRSAADMRKMNELGGGKIAYKLPPSVLPPKYSSVESTPLKYTVEDKANEINIDLTE
jgi:hypothetical protein